MKYVEIDGVSKPISRLVQGSIGIVSADDIDGSFAMLDKMLEHGVNIIDTAHGYGRGDVERVVGRWINDRGVRDKMTLIAKGAHPYGDRPRVTHYDIEADINDSLARFKTDYLDIYLLHRDNPDVPVGPIVEKLNEYHEKGIIGVYGGSNWSVPRIREAITYAKEHSLQPFSISSPNFSLADQVAEPWPDCLTISGPSKTEERNWYAEQNMPLFTWSSMAGGFFSGRFQRDNLDQFDTYADKIVVNSYISEDNFKRLDRAQELASEKGVTVAQIAVAYVFNYPLNIFPLVSSRTEDELKQNIAAMELELTQAEMDWLDLRSDSR